MKIVLGSASPRRSELLRQMGFEFRILKADCSEEFDESETLNKLFFRLLSKKPMLFKTT